MYGVQLTVYTLFGIPLLLFTTKTREFTVVAAGGGERVYDRRRQQSPVPRGRAAHVPP